MPRQYSLEKNKKHRNNGPYRRREKPLLRANPVLYGRTYKLGEVHEGAATMDWMEQEQDAG